MSWRDKDEFGDPSAFGDSRRSGSWWRRTFFRGDNPIRWGVPVMRVSGILVQLSFLFVIYAAVLLITSAFDGTFKAVALALFSLFLLVLLHEFGHSIACRRVGGESDYILLWPLGGLAYCSPPHTWHANFITAIGGPMVNVILVPVLALALHFASGGSAQLLFNPFDPLAASTAYWSSIHGSESNFALYAKQWLWWLYYTNAALLLFNVCLPFFPMDGGRIVQTLLWRQMGYRRSMMIATTIGLAGAATFGVIALVMNNKASMTFLGLAIFGGITCWNERRMLAGAYETADEPYGSFLGRGSEEDEDDEPAPKPNPNLKHAAQAEREQAEVDRILAKIRREGQDSLTRKERRTLEGATKRLRGS